MSYKALYNKYRSQTFEEVVGQNPIIKTLQNSLITGKINHAYLFSGPRGTGKTSVARLFAKALNCSEGIGKQCNICDNCRQISEGNHPDVIEIDAASNSSVDEVRLLIENVKYSPMKGKYKIYIIDEVHMMSNNAFNALLKTLEEPPSYCVFILCTTEPYKLLPTILSRCQRFEFKKIDDDSLKELITRVLQKEKISIDEESLRLITELSNGGARDCLSMLDQLIAYSGDQIVAKDIQSVFGLTSKQEKAKLLDFISKKDGENLIVYYEDLIKRHIDIRKLNDELLDVFKEILLFKKVKRVLSSFIYKEFIESLEKLFTEKDLINAIDLLLKCQNEFKTTSNPNSLFEIYLLKLVENDEAMLSIEKVIAKEEVKPTVVKEEPLFKQEPIPAPVVQPQPKPVEQPKIVEQPKPVEEPKKPLNELPSLFDAKNATTPVQVYKSPLATEGDIYGIDKKTLIDIMVTGNKKAKLSLLERWNYLDEFQNDNDKGAFAMLLKDGKPYIVTPDIVLVSFDYDKQAYRCNIKENQKCLSEIMRKLIGKQVFVYGINRKVLTEITQEYLNLKQVNKLPKIEEIGKIDISQF